MVWRRRSLAAKLFTAVAAVALLVLALVAGAVALSMRSGFSHYLLQTEITRLSALTDAIATRPDAQNGWPELARDGAWELLLARFDETPNRRGPPPPPPQRRATRDQGPLPPPRRLPPRLADRLSLFDAQGRHVAGPGSAKGQVATRNLSTSEGVYLGRLQLQAEAAASAPADGVFVREQLRTLAIVTIVAMALAAIVAFFLARQFVAPIRVIASRVNRLAAGDYALRLPVDRSDELGQLIEDHNALAESLEASRRREREWLSDASHELKTPLAVLRAEIEALQDGVRKPTPAVLAGLHAAAMRLSRLIADINILAEGEELGLALNAGHCCLDEITHEAVEAMDARAHALGLSLSMDATARLPVLGDAVRLRQVVDNLLDNACRYTEAPGRVEIKVDEWEGRARLQIDDTPPCPPHETLPKLFDRFFRPEASRARAAGGSGLGLAICRSVVERYGGTIGAKPSPLGGLKLTVLLPLAGDPTDVC